MTNKTTPISRAIDQMAEFTHTYGQQAITDAGKGFADLAVKFFEYGADDNHLRGDRAWLVTYQQESYDTEATTIGQNPDYETKGTWRVTFALPGKASRDDSSSRLPLQDNWGNQNFRTQAIQRREEAQTSRAVASCFGDLVQRRCNQNNLMIKDYNVIENDPHVESQTHVWFPMTVNIRWELWWR